MKKTIKSTRNSVVVLLLVFLMVFAGCTGPQSPANIDKTENTTMLNHLHCFHSKLLSIIQL